MHELRRYASFVALLVVLTSGPIGAWHVASETVPAPACHPVADGDAVADAHDVESRPDGTGCVACHLLQHIRGPVSAVAVPGAASPRQARHRALEQSPAQIALVALVPARAPPPARS